LTFELRAALNLATLNQQEGRKATRSALARLPEPEQWPEVLAARKVLQ
jgi:hypothetical protein